MTTWIQFKDVDQSELCTDVVGGTMRADGSMYVWGEHGGSPIRVHPDDADRVWAELCAMCKPDHSGDANKMVPPERVGPEVRRVVGSDESFVSKYVVGGRHMTQWSVYVDTHCGFPAPRLDDLGRFIADCVGGTYVGEKP